MVRVREGIAPEELEKALAGLGAKVRARKPLSGIWLVSFANPDLDTVGKALKAFAAVPETARYAEPDYIVHASVLPNDTSFTELWGLHNTGQAGGTADADIDAPEAWDLQTGSRSVAVGVIDTGIDHSHPDLAANMWVNPGEIAGNGLDDDGNGYVDDTRGWDFVNNDNNPMDDNQHGTHCAGTIGAAGNDGSGVAGVNWQVSLVGLKFLSGSGSGTTSDAVEAVAYATDLGVDLTSNSWGGGGFSQALKDVIDEANAEGILFVAAAGNAASDTDTSVNYPSGYSSENILAVASTTQADELSGFSNYGAASVDLGAPGSDIYSTVPGGGYGTLSGTSMATPHVAGACALLKAHRSTLTASEIKGLLMQSVDTLPALSGKCVSGGRLNVHKALLAASDLTISPGHGLLASGPLGGPFSPMSQVLTLTNRGSTTADWTAAVDKPWVGLSSLGGTLAAGGVTTLTVTLKPLVSQLPAGRQMATLTVTNVTGGGMLMRTVELDVIPPVLYTENLDADPGWPRTGPWAYGTPTGGGGVAHGGPDPTAGKTGTKVLGVNLNGDYSIAPGGPYFVTAGPFDLTQKEAARLEFQRWLNTDWPGWVQGTVEISTNGTNWTKLWQNGGEVADTAWVAQQFDISAVADGQPQVWLRWGHAVVNTNDVWAYSGWNIDDIIIRAATVKRLTLALPASVTEGTAPVTVTLSVTPVPEADQTVTLESSDAAQATVPATVVIPAGQSSVTFPLTVVDDALADGTQSVTLTASSAGFAYSTISLDVHDNETRALSLSLPATVTEGAGTLTGQATVSLDAPADRPVRVFLTSSDATELSVPASVVIPAGQSSMAFDVTVPEDELLDGLQSLTVSATVQNWTSATSSVSVADNETFALTLSLPASVLEGQAATAMLSLSGQLTAPLAVTLSSTDSGEVGVPAELQLTAGQSGRSFPLAVVQDNLRDGSQPVTITATAAGFTSASGQLVVYDSATPALPASPQPAAGAAEIHPDADLSWSVMPGTGLTPASFDVYLGTSVTLTASDFAGNTLFPRLTLSRLVPGTTYFWQVRPRKGTVTSSGPVWSFTVPEVGVVDHFSWSAFPASPAVDTPFAVTVTALDRVENVVGGFSGPAALSVVTHRPLLVISEVSPNGHIEFTNASSEAVDVSGWRIHVYDNAIWPAAHAFTIPDRAVCAAGEAFWLRETGPGTFPELVLGKEIDWSGGGAARMAVLLTRADGTPVDFVCAAAGNPSQIRQPRRITGAEWSGVPAKAILNTSKVFQRFGISDRDTSLDWREGDWSYGVNPGLVLPFPIIAAPEMLPVQTASFVNGVWSGDVRVRGAGEGFKLRASDAAGHLGDSQAFSVSTLGLLSLTTSASSYLENAGTVPDAITVTLPAAAAQDVSVTIGSSDASEVASLTLLVPAGQTSASAALTLVDDALLDGTQVVTLDASAAGYTPQSLSLAVQDSETATLTLNLPTSVNENAGPQAASVQISAPAGEAVTVSLSSSDMSEITLPASVVIPAGQSSVSFDLAVQQDTLADGMQNVTLTASVTGWIVGTAAVQVLDDETGTLSLSGNGSLTEGGAGILTISHAGTAVADLIVTLSSSDATEVTLPATITLPEGQSSVSVPLTVIDDALADGTQPVTLSASLPGQSAVTLTLDVQDNDAASFAFGAISGLKKEGVAFPVTVTAYDVNNLPLAAVTGPVVLTAGALAVEPGTLTGFTNGVWSGNVRVMAAGTNIRLTATGPHAMAESAAFDVGMGPRLSVNPASLAVTVPQNMSKTLPLTLMNNGSEPLTWSTRSGFEWQVAAVERRGTPKRSSEGQNVFFVEAEPVAENITPAAAVPLKPLEEVLSGLNQFHAEIGSLIPNRFDFTEGVTGNQITSGGGMYAGGNKLVPGLDSPISTAPGLDYSDNAIVSSTRLGEGGRYFTRKHPGLFVFAADISGLASFGINGSLNGTNGSMDESYLEATRGGRSYRGYVKRVYGKASGSVNHLFINTQNSGYGWSENTSSDFHYVSNLTAERRLYYLLFSSANGGYINDEQMEAIMGRFLDTVAEPAWLRVSPAEGTLAPAQSATLTATFDAVNRDVGVVEGALAISSNDARQPELEVPATMTVTPGLAQLTWDVVPAAQANVPFTATVRAKDATGQVVTDFQGPVMLSAVDATDDGLEVATGHEPAFGVHPLSGVYPVMRSQCIYLPEQVGEARKLTRLSIYSNGSGYPRLTIRLKNTSRTTHEDGVGFESAGWTVVYQDTPFLNSGWNELEFTAPFEHAGGALMVDFSSMSDFFNGHQASIRAEDRPGQALHLWGYSGNPLTWGPGTPGQIFSTLPLIKLYTPPVQIPVVPAVSGPWVNGMWTGNVTLPLAGSMLLRAEDASGIIGLSSAFPVAGTAVTLSLPASATEGTAPITGTLTAASAPPADVVFTLENLTPGLVTAPATVTLPAGQASVSFEVSLPDDALLETSKTATLRASASGFSRAQASMTVVDDETAVVSLTLPASITEAQAGVPATVSLSTTATDAQTITLTSSNTTLLPLPPSVTIPAGQSSITFYLAVPENEYLDGDQMITVTAERMGSAVAEASVLVMDNESMLLSLTNSSSSIMEGSASSMTLAVSGNLRSPLVVTLSSSNPAQLTVPATVTILADSFYNFIPLTAVEDAAFDGTVPVTISASAAGFQGASRLIQVLDNDVHHFSFVPISAQVRNKPFSITLRAADVNDETIPFTGTVNLSAKEGSTSLGVTPATLSLNQYSTPTFSVTVTSAASAAVLTATSGSITGSSNAFTAGHGGLSKFSWNVPNGPTGIGVPFPVTLTALDEQNNTVSSHTQPANLQAVRDYLVTEPGTGTSQLSFPFGSYQKNRCQIAYTAAQISQGAAATPRWLRGIALDIQSISSPSLMKNLTIRLQHLGIHFSTERRWMSSGWTTVYAADRHIEQTGWLQFDFSTPFLYDGSSPLLVDISGEWESAFGASVVCRGYTATSPVLQTLFYSHFIQNVPPLQWSGTSPLGSATASKPNIRFISWEAEAASPAVTGDFTAGVWSSSVSVAVPGQMRLLASSPDGAFTGMSSAFTVPAAGVLALSITPTAVLESAGTVSATVSVTPAPAADMLLSFSSSNPLTGASVPASITLPAGQSSASVPITIIQDTEAEGVHPVTLRVSTPTPGYLPAQVSLQIQDDDAGALTLQLPEIMPEGGRADGVVTLPVPASADVTLNLLSSDPARLFLEEQVIIPAGERSATFRLDALDNNLIEFDPQVSVTAFSGILASSTLTGTATTQISDNESHDLVLNFSTTTVREGAAGTSGTLVAGGRLAVPVTVTLSASEAGQMTFPATVTLPASSGTSMVNFSVSAVDDALRDGTRPVTLTASAPGFEPGTRAFQVLDNDVNHFVLSSIPSSQVKGRAFPVTVTAKDVNNLTLTTYNQPAVLSAADGSTTLPVTPATLTTWSSGVSTANVTVNAFASAAVLRVEDPAGPYFGLSNAFALGAGAAEQLVWDSIATPQAALTPFSVTINAKDAQGNPATSYTGPATLSAGRNVAEATLNAGTVTSHRTFGTSFNPVKRSTTILPASQAALGPRSLRRIGFEFASSSAVTLQNLTIRLKHTTRTVAGELPGFETEGWTTVYQRASTTLPALGWYDFEFSSPFAYDGTSNLLVDISSTGATDTVGVKGAHNASHTLQYEAYAGNPLLWTGSVNPYQYFDAPAVRLLSYDDAQITPAQSGVFSQGAWTGEITALSPGNLALIARDATGAFVGRSNLFTVPSLGTLSLTPSAASLPETAATSSMTLTLNAARASDLTVSLLSTHPSVLLPASVTIPAGQTSLAVPFSLADDSVFNGPRLVTLRARADGLDEGSASFTMLDDETTTITLNAPASIMEGDAGSATISFPAPVQGVVHVSLSASPAGIFSFPISTITLFPGESRHTFQLLASDNFTTDPLPTQATITATYAGSPPSSRTIVRGDDEYRQLTLELYATALDENAPPLANGLRVRTYHTVSSPLTVTLSSSDTSELTVPPSVTIPAGSFYSAFVPLTPVDDTLLDGPQTVVVSASSTVPGFNVARPLITIRDNEVHHFAIAAISSPKTRGVSFPVTFNALDAQGNTVPAFNGTLALTAADGASSIPVSPTSVTFTGGTATVPVTLTTLASTAVLTITDASSGLQASSNPFVVQAGAATQITWSTLPATVASGVDIPVTLTAQDAVGDVSTSFNGSATLTVDGFPAFTVTPAATPAFVNGTWSGTVKVNGYGSAKRLKATSGALSGFSSPFDLDPPFTLNLSLSASQVVESAGTLSGTISLSTAQATSTVITLTSTDTSEAVPAASTVTIPAGSTSAAFTLNILNDSLQDGAQNVILTASHALSPSVTAGLSVRDDDLNRFGFAAISPQTAQAPFSITVNALTLDGMPATAFTGTTTLSCTSSGAGALISPTATTAFSGGSWTGNVTIAAAGTSVVIHASSSSFSGSSAAFVVAAPPTATAFAWDVPAGPKVAGTPFPVTLRAVTSTGATFPGFAGAATLSMRQPVAGSVTLGTDVANFTLPFATQQVMRCQIIHPAAEMGGAARLSSTSLRIHSSSSQTFQNFTIRLKHTPKQDFTSFSWEPSGWTTVYQASRSFSFTGWADIGFTTQCDYNGVDNLMVDISYNNGSTTPTSTPQFRHTPDSSRRMLFASGTSAALGDPLLWSGSTPAPAYIATYLHMRFGTGESITLTPGSTGGFTNGIWSGNLTLPASHPGIVLEAVSGSLSGFSPPIAVGAAAPVLQAEPAFTGGTQNTLQATTVPAASGYEIEAATSSAFTAPSLSGPLAAPLHTFTGLIDGSTYHFRARSTTAGRDAARIWSRALRSDFSTGTLSGTSITAVPGDVSLQVLSTTDAVTSELFDQADTAWTTTSLPVFTTAGGGTVEKVLATAGPATTPALPVNQGTDRVARLGAPVFALASDTPAENFADGVIEAYIAPESLSVSTVARLMLRAAQSSPTVFPSGYAAQATFNSVGNVSVDLVILTGGNASSLTRLSLNNYVFSSSENLKLRLTASGPTLSVQAWRVSIVSGSLVETPLQLSTALTTLSVTDHHFGSGRAAIGSSGSLGSKALFDNLTLTRKNRLFSPSGTYEELIRPLSVSRWGRLDYSSDVTAPGSSLTVDALDTDGTLLAANISSGADLGLLPALSGKAALKLRANLSTLSQATTPLLRAWSLRYDAHPSGPIGGPCSPALTSTQDATPPVLTIPTHTTTAAGITLAGSSVDATSGLASVLVGSTPAATSNAFATWTSPVSGLVDGPNSFTITASDNAVPPNTTTATAIVFRLESPAADTDDNGINSLMEHALGIPAGAANARTMLPAATTESESGQNYLCMQFRRRIQRAGLTYTIETSADLLTWDATGASVIEKSAVPTGDGITELVTVRVTPAVNLGGAKFVRLRITTN
ncbi:MAG: S8 family serine peptidase [Verrucomicrobiaceae bacterium]|nr:S8 family serine peptidase [Verrucomicrobiaceae bacterium]